MSVFGEPSKELATLYNIQYRQEEQRDLIRQQAEMMVKHAEMMASQSKLIVGHMQALTAASERLTAAIEALNRPRTVVRDSNGAISGVK